jgi:polar amino acid transport system substrate-binding protein
MARPALLAIAAVCLTAVLPTVSSAACEPDKLAQKYPSLARQPLRVATTGDSPPFNYRDPKDFNVVTGFNADMMRAVGRCIGMKVEFLVSDFSGLISGVQAGHVDLAVSTIQYLPVRAQQVDYVIFMNGTAGVVVRKDSPRKINSLSDLCGLRGAATVGGTQIGILERLNNMQCQSKPIDVTATPGGPGGPLLVHNNRVDFYLGPATIQSFDASLFKIAYTYATGNRLGAILKKGRPELGRAVLEAMKEIQADGTEEKLLTTYLLAPALSAPAELVTE